MGEGRSMRAVRQSGRSPQAKVGKIGRPSPGLMARPENRLRSNRRAGRVKNLCQWVGEKAARR